MRLLAIETSTIACSAALALDGEIHERFEIVPRRHADLLLPMIGELLADAGMTPGQLDALAFGRGPGAFTGLRIAAAAAQGIAFGAGIPVAPVSTLAALAQGADGGQAKVLAAMDARMNEVYWAACVRDGDGLMCLAGEERVCAPADVPRPDGDGWFGVGDGWDAHGVVLRERVGSALVAADAGRYPHARDVALLGLAMARDGGLLPPELALPVYLRDRVALRRSERAASRQE